MKIISEKLNYDQERMKVPSSSLAMMNCNHISFSYCYKSEGRKFIYFERLSQHAISPRFRRIKSKLLSGRFHVQLTVTFCLNQSLFSPYELVRFK